MPLYKYVTEDRIDILTNGMIRFSQPSSFNDPFEFKPHISSLGDRDYIEEFFHNNSHEILLEQFNELPDIIKDQVSFSDIEKIANDKNLLEVLTTITSHMPSSFENSIHDSLDKKIGILCLAESVSPDNLLMWSHYSNSHQGFAIEFNKEHSFFDQRITSNDEIRHLTEVTYSQARPNLALANIDGIHQFFIKSKEWAYENEWRMIFSLDKSDKTISNTENSIYLFKFPQSAIKSITFGCKTNEYFKKQVSNLITNQTELQHIKIYEAKIDRVDFKLNITTQPSDKGQ